MKLFILFLVTFLTGCGAVSDSLQSLSKSQVEVVPRLQYQPSSNEGQLHGYIEQLARQLFDTANTIDVNRPLIVGTFLPAQTLTAESNKELMPYGIQLQESFMTFSTQAGLNVVEFKTLSAIKVTPNADLMISREVAELNERIKAEYLLTGTYMQQQNSLIVNVKLINFADKSLVAAATDYIPLNSMWSHNKVQMKNQRLYRGEY